MMKSMQSVVTRNITFAEINFTPWFFFYDFYLLYIECEIRSLRRSNQINKNERKEKRNKVFRYYGFIVFTAQKQGSKLFACFLSECGTEEKIIYNSELIYLYGI